MKRSRFSEEKIIGILLEHQAGLGAEELCRSIGTSDATYHYLRKLFGRMGRSQLSELKSLEKESVRLKKMLVNQMMGVATLKRDARKNF